MPEKIARADKTRLVIFFNEFQSILELDDSNFSLQSRMRAIFQESPNISFIFTGSIVIVRLMNEVFSSPKNPFGIIGNHFVLDAIETEDWMSELSHRFRKAGIETIEQDLMHIVFLAKKHPYSTMLIAQQTYLLLRLNEEEKLTKDYIQKGYYRALELEEGKHNQFIERIKTLNGIKNGMESFKVIKNIANQQPSYDKNNRYKTQRTFDSLKLSGFIEKNLTPVQIISDLPPIC